MGALCASGEWEASSRSAGVARFGDFIYITIQIHPMTNRTRNTNIASWGGRLASKFLASVGICALLLMVAACYYQEAPEVARLAADDVVAELAGKTVEKTVHVGKKMQVPEKCEMSLGFIPCSDHLGGAIVHMILYGGVLMLAAQFIGDGGEALLDHGVMSPALIGGVLLPILGAIPDTVIIAMSGMTGTVADAERKVSVGIGTLAGSTIMLLTVAVSGRIHFGRVDLDQETGEGLDETFLGEKYNRVKGQPRQWENWCQQLKTTGVTHTKEVLAVKYYMLATSLVYVIVQIGQFVFGTKGESIRLCCIISAGIGAAMLVVYLVMSVLGGNGSEKQVVVKENREARAKQAFDKFLEGSQGSRVIEHDGSINKQAIRDIFNVFDLDGNQVLDSKEVDRFMGVLFHTNKMSCPENMVDRLQDGQKEKFRESVDNEKTPLKGGGCVSCVRVSRKSKDLEKGNDNLDIEIDVFIERVAKILEEESHNQTMTSSSEELEEAEVNSMSVQAALGYILLGTSLVVLFSDGVVTAIDTFGTKTHIPNFVVGFVVCPFASNASELISSLQFAAAKRSKNISVTFSQIYAACTMNNTLCLGVLLTMVYVRHLKWDYTAEVACILFATWAIGAGTCGTTIKYGFAVFALLICPISLGLVEGLHAVNIL